jgi:hypothetical protein
VKVRLHDKLKALVKLGEYLGILGPKAEPAGRGDPAPSHGQGVITTTREEASEFFARVRGNGYPGRVPQG